MSKFLTEKYSFIKPYTPGEQPKDKTLVKLNTNESPFPPSPKAIEAAAKAAQTLNLYSDPENTDLIDAIAENYGVAPSNVIAGNGSDEILAFCFQAFCDEKIPAFFADVTYGFYKVFAKLYGVEAKIIPLKDDFSICPEEYYNIGGTAFIANPNAPTGMTLSLEQIEGLLKSNPDNIIVIDEAYVDFGGESAIPLTKCYENLIVVQTFSKSRGLAGGRIGFAVANAELIADLKKIKYSYNPYNVGAMPQAAAAASMRDKEYFEKNRAEVIRVREMTVTELEKMGFTVLPSKANFIFARANKISGADYFKALRENGIIVRYFDAPRINEFVRISIGTQEQMQKLLSATKKILEERV
ncbi:MAG: histidinol-phosphate transaminase [Clostridia bacterium]|nr:histidinol-phosphate transaminase [Clostridia bacterium]